MNVVANDNPEDVRDSLSGAGIVVVDEAQNFHRGHRLFEILPEKTKRVRRFLLLSATPVLRNENEFLDMLQLLVLLRDNAIPPRRW